MRTHIGIVAVAVICFGAGFGAAWLTVASEPAYALQDAAAKGAKVVHGLDLPVRKVGQKEFGKDDKRFAVEVYRDENNGNLIYITDTGAISVVPGK
jgi:hypothetical protein